MKNVNDTDLNISRAAPAAQDPCSATQEYCPQTLRLIELFFFAYRDFVAAPDEILARQGFGRAHHRVLHFVNRHAGMPVTHLLDILKITKQSLARVLGELIKDGFIIQKEGQRDRRQRLLYTTPKGKELALTLAQIQSDRIASALIQAGATAGTQAEQLLFAMIDAQDQALVAPLIAPSSAAIG